jgi:uncharacterized protein (TIGR03435 family)
VQFDPQPGRRLHITNASLRMVMAWAYGVQDSQLAGGPDWAGTARFDFVAKAEGNPSITQEQLGRAKAPVNVLVIDQVEKPTAD